MKRFWRRQNINLIKVILSLIIAILILFLTGVFNQSEKSFLDYIEVKTFIAIVLFFVLDTVSFAIISMISKWYEDSNKLTNKYDQLMDKIYPLEDPYVFMNPNKEKVRFPNVIFKEFKFKSDVIIKDDSKEMFLLPEFCRKHYDDLLSAHHFSKTQNMILFRLDDLVIENDQVRLTTSRTTSYDVLASNRSMDYQIGDLSVRETNETGPFLSKLNESKMANHAGYTLMAETNDGYILMYYRLKNTETYKGSLGPTMTNTIAALSKENELTIDNMEKAITNGLKKRIGKQLKNSVTFKNNLIGISRSLVEGGGIHFILHARLNETFEELYDTKSNEQTIIKIKTPTKRKLIAIHKNVLANTNLTIDTLMIGNKTYKSSPSTLIAVAMMINHFGD